MSYQEAELDRRMAAMLQAGTVSAVDHGNARCRVKVGEWESAWLPWGSAGAGAVRQWRPPSIGEQAMILSPSGLPEGGFVLPGFYTTQHKNGNDTKEEVTATDYPDGAREHYDHGAHEYVLKVPAGGRIVLTIGATTLELRDDGTTLTTPKLFVDSADSTFTGMVLVKKLLSYLSGLVGKGGGGVGASIEGEIQVNGSINATGSVIDGGGNSNHHTH